MLRGPVLSAVLAAGLPLGWPRFSQETTVAPEAPDPKQNDEFNLSVKLLHNFLFLHHPFLFPSSEYLTRTVVVKYSVQSWSSGWIMRSLLKIQYEQPQFTAVREGCFFCLFVCLFVLVRADAPHLGSETAARWKLRLWHLKNDCVRLRLQKDKTKSSRLLASAYRAPIKKKSAGCMNLFIRCSIFCLCR